MNKNISYIARDYEDLENQLKNFVKQYFPNNFNDFGDYSLESMLLQMNAYVGDVLNFYIDDRYKQNFIDYTYDLENMYRVAKALGYKPQTVTVAYGNVEFSQVVPAVEDEGKYIPDVSQTGTVLKDTLLSNNSGNSFYYVIEDCNLKDYDRSEVNETGAGNVPDSFVIYKSVKVHSGIKKRKTIDVGDYEAYLSLPLDKNVSFVTSVTDDNEEENKWYEVDFLAQDTIFESIKNKDYDNLLSQYHDETPFLLKPKRVSRRFVLDHLSTGEAVLKFGSGLDTFSDNLEGLSTEDLLTTNSLSNLSISQNFAIENFLKNDSFGLVPQNTSLTINYVIGEGDKENARPNSINNISQSRLSYAGSVSQEYIDTLSVNNSEPVSGAGFVNSLEKIRRESKETFASQRRCVTAQDYMIRSKLLPSKYGSVSKVFVEKNRDPRFNNDNTSKTINMYVLSYDSDRNLTNTNQATKRNLKMYINEFRMLSDTINILDAYIINLGVYFEFVSQPDYQKDEVLLNISKKVEEFFDVDRIEINQPIIVEELRQRMYEAEGVGYISKIDFYNKTSVEDGYSSIGYDVSFNGANFGVENGILYPPKDIGIFELKYPLTDISGKHV